jgi:hypothetical protein
MVDWMYSSTVLELGTSWRQVVSFTPLPIYPKGKSSLYSLDRSVGGPHIQRGRCGEHVICHCRESNADCPARRYVDSLLFSKSTTELSCLYII